MTNYIDSFVFPIPQVHLKVYKQVAEKVGNIWKEHGAKAYMEFIGDDLKLEGTRSFVEVINAKEDEVIIFGWVVFESREVRDRANELVANDPRMKSLTEPLQIDGKMIFDAERMAYGGFQSFVQSK